MADKTICWFRQDLRLKDNPALSAAILEGDTIPLFILDDETPKEWRFGAASRWWLHQSLMSLNNSLDGNLWVEQGNPEEILTRILKQTGAKSVHWNRCYEPWQIARDKRIKKTLTDFGSSVQSHNGCLLWEPWTTLKKDGTPYKVFTPFYKNGLTAQRSPSEPLNIPSICELLECPMQDDKISALNLLPDQNWTRSIASEWTPGESHAHARLKNFLKHGIHNYKEGRDIPDRSSVSRLSPHLKFGEISPNFVAWQVKKAADSKQIDNLEAEHFTRELIWREFSYSLIYFFPKMTNQNFKRDFTEFPWRSDEQALKIWQQGKTGYPIVDAGMRELWQTGYMHNRVRMIVASFLTKNLMVHWIEGARWFWDCLVDADLASNTCSWQWVAGTGADAAPYFRIFNPVTQSQKFDSNGAYIRKFVPELASVPIKHLHDPSNAPEAELLRAGITLCIQYPRAIVDLKETRKRALDAYKGMREI